MKPEKFLRAWACLKIQQKNWTCNFQSIEPNSQAIEQGRNTLPFSTISWT